MQQGGFIASRLNVSADLESPMMSTEWSTASIYVRYLPQVLERSGYDPEPFLKRQRLTLQQLKQSDFRLSYQTYIALLRDILANTDIAALGLKTAAYINLRNQGLFGYAMLCCRNLRQAFDIYATYARLQSDIIHDNLKIEGGTATYSLDVHLFSVNEEITRFEVEEDFALWFRAAEMWWERPEKWFQEVRFTFPRPKCAALYEELFQCPLKFRQPTNQFTFSTEYMQLPFTGFNSHMMHFTEEQCAKLLNERTQSDGLTGRIKTLLSRSGNRIPSSADVATILNLSEITLRRRLRDEGTNYKTLVYEFRMGLAGRYLAETLLSAKEIAYLTGYTSPANFTRAFTRFFGISPREYRVSNLRVVRGKN